MRIHLLAIALVGISTSLAGQSSPASVSAIEKLSFLTGNWKGTGWAQMGEDTDSITVTQDVKIINNGSALQMDVSIELQSNGYVVNTVLLVSYDSVAKQYHTSARDNDGSETEGEAKLVNDNTLLYWFSPASEIKIRYTFSVTDKIHTVKGELSTDNGTTWVENFGARLTR